MAKSTEMKGNEIWKLWLFMKCIQIQLVGRGWQGDFAAGAGWKGKAEVYTFVIECFTIWLCLDYGF